MKSVISKLNRIALIIVSSITLVACGTGGTGGSGDHIPNPVISVIPGDSPLYVGMEVTLSAADSSDQDGDQLSYAWSQPQDQAIALTPSSADTSAASNVSVSFIASAAGTYTFILTVSDGKYEVSTEVTLDIVIDDSNEAPAFTSSSDPLSVAENSSGVIHTATASDADNDALTYSLSGSDADDFSIDASSGALSFASAPDFEAPSDADGDNVYELSLRASDGRAIVSQDLTVTVTDVNEAPSFTSSSTASAAENNSGTVYTATASDVDASDTLSYSLVGGADLKLFALNGTELSFIEAPDYESLPASGDNVYEVELRVTDSGDLSTDLALSITVTDVNEAPSFTSGTSTSVSENTSGTVYTATASDVDASDTQTYSLVGGADQELFALNGADLSFIAAPDYESLPASGDNTYEVQLRVTDSGDLSTDLSLSITVTDVNEAPSFTSAPASTNAAENTSGTVYTATAQDPEDVLLVFTISGTDADAFSISTTTSTQAEIAFSTPPNFEAPADSDGDNVYELTLQVTDGSTAPISQAISISVTNVNEFDASFGSEPDADSATNQIAENATAGTAVGITAAAVDGDAGTSISYAFAESSSTSAILFSIDASSGIITLRNSNSLDFESASSHELVIVAASSDGSAATHTFTVAVTDINEAPAISSAAAVSVNENTSGTAYTVIATDVDADDTLTYELIGGADQALFNLNGADLSFVTAPDYETLPASGDNVYEVELRVTDSGSLSSALSLSITITDINEAPTITSATSTSATENSAGAIYNATVSDVDADDSHTYSLIGGADQALFTLTGAELSFQSSPNYESPADSNTDNIYEVELRVVDSGGLSAALSLSVTVTNINEAPSFTSSAAINVDENSAGAIYTASASDVDTSDTHTYELIGGADRALFSLNGAELSFVTAPDYETLPASGDNVYEVQLRVTDSGSPSLSSDLSLNITVTDINEAPSFTSATSTSAAENSAGAIYTATVGDVDADDSHTFSLTGGADQALFTLAGAELSFQSSANYESPSDSNTDNIYEVELRATDSGGLSADLSLSITVTNVNEAPTFTSAAATSAAENTNGVVYTAAASDVDAGDTHTYELVGGADLNLFSLSGGDLSFINAPNYESPSDSGADNLYQVQLRVTDSGSLSSELSLSITITDINEAPTFTSSTSTSVAENSAGTIYTATVSDADTGDSHSYELVGGADQALFILSGADLSFIAAPDYETLPASGDNVYEVQLRVTDSGGLSADLSLSVTVTNANEAPTFTSSAAINVDENSAGVIYTATASDVDTDDTHTYELIGGADQTLFSLNGADLSFITAPDYETLPDSGDNVYEVQLRVTDSGNPSLSSELSLSITVDDVAEAPTFASASASATAPENSTEVFYIALARDDDAASSISYSLASGGDNTLFNINSTNGALNFLAAPDYESPNDSGSDGTYNITISASDGALSSVLALVVTVGDVNEAPEFSSTSATTDAPENSTAAFYTVSADDQDADTSMTYTLYGGADVDFFDLDASSGSLSFKQAQDREAAANDADSDYIYAVEIAASDGSLSAPTNLTLSVTLTNVNEAPTVTNTVREVSVLEATANSTVNFAYTITGTDPEGDLLTFTLGGNDASAFDINSGTGAIGFKAGSSPDYDTPADANGDNVYELALQAQDSSGDTSDPVSLQITIIDVSSAPTFLDSAGNSLATTIGGSDFADSLELTENATGVVYTVVSVDDDGVADFSGYSVTGGADAAAFSVGSSSGELSFNTTPDYELPHDDDSDNIYVVQVTAADTDESTMIELSITVTNLNDSAPTIAAQSLSVNEDAADSSEVGTVEVSDADDPATTYQNWQITGGNTNSAFAIDADGLITVADTSQIDFETIATSYALTVEVSDGDNTGSGTVTININDINDEAPFVASASYDLAENASADDPIDTLSATDPDTGLTTTYSAWTITSGNTDGIFALNPDTGDLTVADTTNLDYDTGAQSYDLSVTVSDGANTSAAETITVTLTDVNDNAPVITANQAFSTSEASPNTTVVGTVLATDPDGDGSGTTFQDWSITGGTGSTAFAIDPSTGVITVANTSELDYSSGTTSYTLNLTVSDGTNTSAEQSITITIEENILPTDLAASSEPGKVTLTWSSTSSSGTITYEIYRSSDPDCNLVSYSLCSEGALLTSATSPQADTGVTIGTTYYYWIKADRSDGLSQTSATPINATPKAGLNDTGVDWAGDSDTANSSDCSSSIAAPQDCHQGRDATNHDDADGNAGFSFTKLDSNGNELLATENSWSCVRDNITGLTWEVKTTEYALHYRGDTFKHYDTNTSTNGGDNGYDAASDNTCYGYNSSNSSTFCNTEAFVERVNSSNLCGYNDWRMPTYSELISIADFGELVNNRAADYSFFPYYSYSFWSSTVRATSSSADVGITAYSIHLSTTNSGAYGRNTKFPARLVRQ